MRMRKCLISLPIANTNGQVFKRQLPCVFPGPEAAYAEPEAALTKCRCLKGSPSKPRFAHLQVGTFLVERMLQGTLGLCHLCCSQHWFG